MSEWTDRLAHALRDARQMRVAIEEDGWQVAVPDAMAAYAVQDGVAALMGWDGTAGPRRWKAGAPNTQAAPTFAPLPADGVHASPATCNRSDHFMVGIEAEVAFRVARDITTEEAARIEVADVPAQFDAMAVSIELVDSRWRAGMAAPPLLRLADLQAHGALVLGAWVPLRAVDWQRQVCSVSVDGVEQGPYTASHPCGDPLWVVPSWLRHAAQRDGVVKAGTVVTTGTWCGIVWLKGAAAVHVSFGGIGQASLAVQ